MRLQVASINLGGVQQPGKLQSFLLACRRKRESGPLDLICAHEHNLHPSGVKEYRRLAIAMGYWLEIMFAAEGEDKVYRGGVLILTNNTSISWDGLDRGTGPLRTHESDGALVIEIEWLNTNFILARFTPQQNQYKE